MSENKTKSEDIKKGISNILLGAVNGLNSCYRTKDGYIRWGLVEKDIHKLIDDRLKGGINMNQDIQDNEESPVGKADVEQIVRRSSDYEYGTLEYFHAKVIELEKDRNLANDEVDYYRTELAKAHEILGRVIHQTSERWDNVRLTKYYPTDNLHNKRNINNPKGEL